MSKFISAEYDCDSNQFTTEGVSSSYNAPVLMTRGDIYRMHLRILHPPYDLRSYSATALIMWKKPLTFRGGGNFDLVFPGYDTSDTFNTISSGGNQASIPFFIPYTLDQSEYITNVALFTGTGGKFEMAPFWSKIAQAEYIGTESNIPSGVPGSNLIVVTIGPGQTSSAAQLVTGLTTATGALLVALENSTGGYTQFSYTITTGQFVITVPQAPDVLIPGASYTFTAWVAHL